MKLNKLPLLLLFLTATGFSQNPSFNSEEIRINKYIKGTLIEPSGKDNPPLVILIQGSGPTDRNGNQSFMKNNSFKKLAEGLAGKGIASFRYDKRIFEMANLGIREEDMRFDDFITDASSAISYFNQEERFGKIIILGHSQGSLVGMVAAQEKADAFISIAGVAKTIDSVIVEQVGEQMPGLKESTQDSFTALRKKGSTSTYNPVLESLFKPALQPFMLSWMKFNPAEEIQKLELPVLILHGSNDLQVKQQEAERLVSKKPGSRFLILEKMNHVLVKVEGGELENAKSYNEPGLPLHPELIPALTTFIEELK